MTHDDMYEILLKARKNKFRTWKAIHPDNEKLVQRLVEDGRAEWCGKTVVRCGPRGALRATYLRARAL